MAKAILITDMPENCGHCMFCVYCAKGAKPLHAYGKPDWCPLIPEPERMTEREVIEIENAVTYTYKNIYAKGWNACLDVLEGKENE